MLNALMVNALMVNGVWWILFELLKGFELSTYAFHNFGTLPGQSFHTFGVSR